MSTDPPETLPTIPLPSQRLTVGVGEQRLYPPAGATHALIKVEPGSGGVVMDFFTTEGGELYAAEEGLEISGAQLAALRYDRAPKVVVPPTLHVTYWQALAAGPPLSPSGNGRVTLGEFAAGIGLDPQGVAYLGDLYGPAERFPEEWRGLLASLLSIPETAWLAGTLEDPAALPEPCRLDTVSGEGFLLREGGDLTFVRLTGNGLLLAALLPGFASAPEGACAVKRGDTLAWEAPARPLVGTRAQRRVLAPPTAVTEYRETDTGISLTYYPLLGWRDALGQNPDQSLS